MDDAPVIYIDVLFLINFCIDYICLYIAGKICHKSAKTWRIILGGAFGGIYSILILYFDKFESLFGVIQFLIHITVAVIICVTAYGKVDIKSVIRISLSFFGASALFGGLLYAVYTSTGKASYYNGAFYSDIDMATLLLLSAGATVIVYLFTLISRKRLDVKTAVISFTERNISVSSDSLIDSGNLLSDPISFESVILIKRERISEAFGKDAIDELLIHGTINGETLTGYRLIPSDRGLICAFKPREIKVKPFGQKEINVSALIGIDTKSGTFGGYMALVPYSLL